MGLKSRLKKSIFNKPKDKPELADRSISNSDVTEESLQTWLALPSKIRHDPSLASFQLEHERLHGKKYDHFLLFFLKKKKQTDSIYQDMDQNYKKRKMMKRTTIKSKKMSFRQVIDLIL